MKIRLIKAYRSYGPGTVVEVTRSLCDHLVGSGVAVVETQADLLEVRRAEAAVAAPQDVRQAVQTR